MATKDTGIAPNATNTAATGTSIDDVNLEGYVEESVGFNPYWKAEEGASFFGTVLAFDDHDPNFKRWTLQSHCDLECFQGSKADGEAILVKKGEFFSVSDYGGLPLSRFYGLQVFVTAREKVTIKGGRTLWKWQVRVDPKVKALLDAKREELVRLAGEASMKRLAPGSTAPALNAAPNKNANVPDAQTS